MRWRDVTTGDPEQVVSFQPTPGADTSWSNTLPSSNYCHDYEVYVNYAGSSSNTFMYSGLGSGYCPEVARLGRTLRAWKAQILAYFDTNGVSNGGTEAINLIIEKVRRLAHGFKDFDHYRLRILLAADRLRQYRKSRNHP